MGEPRMPVLPLRFRYGDVVDYNGERLGDVELAAVNEHLFEHEKMRKALEDIGGRYGSLPDHPHFKWAREIGGCNCVVCVARAALPSKETP